MASLLSDLRQFTAQRGFRALNRVLLPAVKAGVGSPLPIGAGLVVVETTGRSSGLPRQVPLVAARCGSTVAVSTVRSTSQWIKNLEAEPRASVWMNGRRRDVTATIQNGPFNVARLELSDATAPERRGV